MIETTCADCVYKIMDGDTQTGCKTGALDKFGEVYEITEIPIDGKTYKKIPTYCMYRSEKEDDYRERIYPRMSFVVKDTGGEIKATLESVKKVKYYKVVVCTDNDNFAEFVTSCKEIIDCDVVFLIDKDHDIEREAFRRCKNGYVCFVNSGTIIESDMVDRLDYAMHDQMKKVPYVLGYVNVFLAALYKHAQKYNRMSEIIKNLSGFTWDNLND